VFPHSGQCAFSIVCTRITSSLDAVSEPYLRPTLDVAV
jgi:hypothetical protein